MKIFKKMLLLGLGGYLLQKELGLDYKDTYSNSDKKPSNEVNRNGKTSLCFRLNNPGCLRDGASNWKGKTGSEKGFVRFSTMEYGIRASLINLRNTYFNKGLNTISKIMYKYAPPSENNTEKYIADLETWTGFNRNRVLKFNEQEMYILFSKISRKENGFEAFNKNQFSTAWKLI